MTSRVSVTKPSYRMRPRVMNKSEHALYMALHEALADRFNVLSKVRIEDFIRVNESIKSEPEKYGLRSRIKSRHVDFLICDFKQTRPVLAIELDGESHDQVDRVARDKFVDYVYQEVGLPVLHVKVADDFNMVVRKIRARLL